MNILILQGSPRANGNSAWMAEEYRKAAEAAGHKVTLVNVAHKKIAGCLACEYCHGKGNGACVQKDDMQTIIRWHLQRGLMVIPRSDKPEEIAEDIDVFDFELTPREMQIISGLNRNERTFEKNDPETFPW